MVRAPVPVLYSLLVLLAFGSDGVKSGTTSGPSATDKLHLSVAGSTESLSGKPQVEVEVTCLRKLMQVSVSLNDTEQRVVYLYNLKSYPGCQPEIKDGKAVFELPLDDTFYSCGTTKIHNKLTGTRVFYHRVVVEDRENGTKEGTFVKCVVPSDMSRPPFRYKRQTGLEEDLPENFAPIEEDLIDYSGNITQRAAIPYLNIGVRQNGQFVDTALNVSPGTPLEMIIYLDEKSSQVYGLLTSFLKVTDNTPRKQEEIIILNGCSIDPYIFANFETFDEGKSLSAKFRAFKFPESSYVLFVGTVNVCLKQCQGVQCGDGQLGFGRKRRSIPYELPPDPNRVFEVEMTAFLKVGYSSEALAKRKEALISKPSKV